MDDLISRQAAIDAIMDESIHEGRPSVFAQKILNLPSANVRENVRGHWVVIDDDPCDVCECDRCGTTYDMVDSTWDLPNFCPNCGADLREDTT